MKPFIVFVASCICVAMFNIAQAQNIVITDDDTYTADPSAMLDVKSIKKGLLIPRLKTTERQDIPDPAIGLLVFDVELNTFYFYDGSSWQLLTSGLTGDYNELTNTPTNVSTFVNDAGYLTSEVDGSTTNELQVLSLSNDTIYLSNGGFVKLPANSWTLNGNAGTTAGTNFIGTTDNQSLDIRTNNILKTKITTKGQIETYNTGQSVFIGEGAGANDDLTSNNNVFVGYQAGKATTTGDYNVAIGANSLKANTTGADNTSQGYNALGNNSIGAHNSALGFNSLGSNVSGSNNTAVGSQSLYLNTGNNNTAVGMRALTNNTSSDNTAVGWNALSSNTTGNSNTAVGDMVLTSNITGSNNTAMGLRALMNNSSSGDNSAFGAYALSTNVGGYSNVAFGFNALFSNSSGKFNSALGTQSMYHNTSGSNNTSVGYQAFYNNAGGSDNTAVGYQALKTNVTGYGNTALGDFALYGNSTGYNNTALGQYSLYYNTIGFRNISLGFQSMYSNTVAAYNIGIGISSLYTQSFANSDNIWNTYNIAIGTNALYSNQPTTSANGYKNVATGHYALYLNTTGSMNVATGNSAITSNTTGNNNTAMGNSALYSNTTGSSNTAVGAGAFYNGDTYSNSTAIGASSAITASNQIRLGDANVTDIGGQVGWTTVSDGRFKKDVSENVPGLSFINKLTPVTYHHDMDAIASKLGTSDSLRIKSAETITGSLLRTGFIAQDVENAAKDLGFVFSGVVKPQDDKGYYGLRYAEFTVPLVKAVQELDQKNKELLEIIGKLEKRLEVLENR